MGCGRGLGISHAGVPWRFMVVSEVSSQDLRASVRLSGKRLRVADIDL